jgi:CheY-like chemotaxis protein
MVHHGKGSRMDSFRVLVVDDVLAFISAATRWLEQESDRFPAPPMVIAAGSVTEAAAAVKDCARSGTPINVAIVDLGLGPGQPSGLGAIDLLEKAGIPVAVYTEYGEGTRRLMFVYAAFSWYKPVALLPKSHFTANMGVDRAARTFASDITRISDRQAPGPNLAAYFRPSPSREWPFDRVLSSRSDLLKWRAFVTYSQTAGVAASLGLHPKVIEKWLAAKYDAVWELLQHASKHMDTTYAGIAEPDPGGIGDQRKKQDRQGALHQFARSQSWFFNDPVVRTRFSVS